MIAAIQERSGSNIQNRINISAAIDRHNKASFINPLSVHKPFLENLQLVPSIEEKWTLKSS